MKSSLGMSNFLEEISSLSHSIVFLYFFAFITEEGFLIWKRTCFIISTIDFLFGSCLANVSIVLSLIFIVFEIKKIIYISVCKNLRESSL